MSHYPIGKFLFIAIMLAFYTAPLQSASMGEKLLKMISPQKTVVTKPLPLPPAPNNKWFNINLVESIKEAIWGPSKSKSPTWTTHITPLNLGITALSGIIAYIGFKQFQRWSSNNDLVNLYKTFKARYDKDNKAIPTEDEVKRLKNFIENSSYEVVSAAVQQTQDLKTPNDTSIIQDLIDLIIYFDHTTQNEHNFINLLHEKCNYFNEFVKSNLEKFTPFDDIRILRKYMINPIQTAARLRAYQTLENLLKTMDQENIKTLYNQQDRKIKPSMFYMLLSNPDISVEEFKKFRALIETKIDTDFIIANLKDYNRPDGDTIFYPIAKTEYANKKFPDDFIQYLKTNDLNIFKALLENAFPLEPAIINGKNSFAQLLIDEGAPCDKTEGNKRFNALETATIKKNKEMMSYFVNTKKTDLNKNNILHLATDDVVDILKEIFGQEGLNQAPTPSISTPMKTKPVSVLDLIVEKNKFGNTPLQRAKLRKQTGLIEFFKKNIAETPFNQLDKEDAKSEKQTEQQPKKQGSRTKQKKQNAQEILEEVYKNLDEIESRPFINFLDEHKEFLEKKDTSNPLWVIIEKKYSESPAIFGKYEEYIPNIIQIRDAQKNNFLHLISTQQSANEFALKLDEDSFDWKEVLSTKNADGNTPIHTALIENKKELANLYISNANNTILFIKNNEGNTPLHLAAKQNNESAAKSMEDVLSGKEWNSLLTLLNKKEEMPWDLTTDQDTLKELISTKAAMIGPNPIPKNINDLYIKKAYKYATEQNDRLITALNSIDPKGAPSLLEVFDKVFKMVDGKPLSVKILFTEPGKKALQRITADNPFYILFTKKDLNLIPDQQAYFEIEVIPLLTIKDKNNNNILHWFAQCKDFTEQGIKELIKENIIYFLREIILRGARPKEYPSIKTALTSKNTDGNTPLHVAIKDKNFSTMIMTKIILNSVDWNTLLDTPNNNGKKPADLNPDNDKYIIAILKNKNPSDEYFHLFNEEDQSLKSDTTATPLKVYSEMERSSLLDKNLETIKKLKRKDINFVSLF